MSKRILGIDGKERTAVAERQINAHIVSALGDVTGQAVMAYLKSITIQQVHGPDATDAQLRHAEGMRHLVQILQARIDQGHKEKADG